MKTTIEAGGYVIEISEQENGVVVSATKDGEMVEEFTLDLESVELEGGEVESTEEFTEDDFEGGEEDFDGEESEDEDEDEDEDEVKLESFTSFIKKNKK